jgi:hypothetical protein
MSSPTDRTYSFGHGLIDCQRRELRYDNVAVPIGSRAFEILEKLVGSAGLLVTKDDLIGSVWSGLTVEDNTLQVHISAVRKAFGEIAISSKRFRVAAIVSPEPGEVGIWITPLPRLSLCRPMRPSPATCLAYARLSSVARTV